MDYAQLQIGHNFFQLDIPNGWQDLTAEQFEAVNYLKCTSTDNRLMVFEVLMVVLKLDRSHLLGFLHLCIQQREWLTALNLLWLYIFFDNRKLWQFFATDDVIDALPAIDWLFDGGSNMRTSQVPGFKHKGVAYTGPRTLLSGIIWKQMQLADAIVERFTTEKNEELLNDLAAVLYVPKGEQLNTDNDSINERIQLFTALPIQQKYAIYSNYVLLRDAFYKQFELPKAELAVEGRPDWEMVTLSVAENGSLGTYQQVECTNARTVMKYFEMAHKRERKLNKK
jgi:hypothetical protein